MTYFETFLILVTTLYLLMHRRINLKLQKSYVIGSLVVVLLLHLSIGGYRWQMIPAYLLWVIALFTALRRADRAPSRLVQALKILALILLLVPSVALPSLLPVFKIPSPTGPYSVGTTDLLFESDRDETITSDPDDKRRLMLKVWYPTSLTEGEKDFYVDSGGRNGFARKYGLPASSMNYLDKIDTHVYRDVAIAEEKFPVLIFSHGYNSKANGYYSLLSEVVSHGYVVFSVNHTYESTGTTFPDGSEVFFNYEYAQKIESGTWEMMEPVVDSFKEDLSFEERHPIVKKALESYFVGDIVERWAQDLVDVADELDTWNRDGIFKGRLDLSKVGVFGHSRGGGAAGHSLLKESRIRAGVNLDGVQWGPIVDTTFSKPFLFLAADWPAEHENLNQHAYVNRGRSGFYEGMIVDAAHSNFMDIPFMIPLRTLSQAGSIDPELAHEISSTTVRTFFDRQLKGANVDLNSLLLDYEMLELNSLMGNSIVLSENFRK